MLLTTAKIALYSEELLMPTDGIKKRIWRFLKLSWRIVANLIQVWRSAISFVHLTINFVIVNKPEFNHDSLTWQEAKIISRDVGLRPYRTSGVRLESEFIQIDDRDVQVRIITMKCMWKRMVKTNGCIRLYDCHYLI